MGKMSDRRQRQMDRIEEQRKSNHLYLIAVMGVVAVVVATIVVAGGGGNTAGPGDTEAAAEVERSGQASALGVEADVKTVALGHVPLNTTVEPTWTLMNNSDSEVSLGEAHAEVIEGCCPGPLQFGTMTLAPGETTELVFPLQMHPGMDGPHEFSVHVPITQGSEEAILELATTGHFSEDPI
jgi:hypothetical protein